MTFLLSLVIPLQVHAPIIPHVYTFDIPCYAPTRITFNYAYTHNHSIYDISTFGSSLYTHQGGPTFYEFIAQDVDNYFFSIRIRYSTMTNQTILIGIQSGSLPIQGMSFESIFEDIIIHVRLRVTSEPTYPSEQDVAEAVVSTVKKDLENYYTAIDKMVVMQNTLILTMTGLSIVIVLVLVTTVTINIMELRRFRRMR